ncbi:hypothetical protein D3C86_2213760 [compost metagenome]
MTVYRIARAEDAATRILSCISLVDIPSRGFLYLYFKLRITNQQSNFVQHDFRG